jgi:hypothetical protein
MARVLRSLRLLAREARAWHVRALVKRLGHHSIVVAVHMVHPILASLLRIPRYLRTPVHALTATLTMIRLVPSLVPPPITKLPSAPRLTPGKSPLHLGHFFATLEGLFVREKVKKSLQTWTLRWPFCPHLPPDFYVTASWRNVWENVVSVFDIYEVSRWKIISLQPYANIFFFAIRGIDYAVFDDMEEEEEDFF